MAHTSEERDHLNTPLCGAKKKNGELCRAFAGQGTEHRGVGCCKNHGGSTRSHKSNAIIVEAKRRMVKLGEPIPGIAPHEALLAVLRATAGHVAWLHREVAGLEDLASAESRVVVTLYDSERDRLTRVAKACSEVGVQDREIRVHEREAAIFATAVDKAAGELGMEAEQRRKLHEAIAQALSETAAPDVEHLRKPGAIYSEH